MIFDPVWTLGNLLVFTKAKLSRFASHFNVENVKKGNELFVRQFESFDDE